MLKERIGGTSAMVAKSAAACRIVPSPPSVETRSTFSWSDALFSSSFEDGAKTGKGRAS